MRKKVEEIEKARELRKSGLSINEISKCLCVSKGSVSSWVKDVELSDEQKCILNRLCHNPEKAKHASNVMSKKYRLIRENWQLEGKEKAKEKEWEHVAGCILYWGEGAKKRNTCGLGNADPAVLKFFISFLRKYFKMSNEEFSLNIQVYLGNGKTIEEIQDYWCQLLNLTRKNIKYVKILNGVRDVTGRKKNIHVYGICDLRINRTDIVQHIFGAIQEYIGISNPSWID